MSTETEQRAYVQVPRELLATPGVRPVDVAVWAILDRHCRAGRPIAWPSQAKLMRQLGRPDRRADTITRSTMRLALTGWLRVRRRHWGDRTRNTYEPLRRPTRGNGSRYIRVDADLLQRLTDGWIGPQLLVARARWQDACSEQGWTRDTLSTYVDRYGGSARAAGRLRHQLVAMGLLEVRFSRGSVTVTGMPGSLSKPDESSDIRAGSVGRSKAKNAGSGKAKNAGSVRPKMRHEVPTDEVPTNEVGGSRVALNPPSYVSDAREIENGGDQAPPSQPPNQRVPGEGEAEKALRFAEEDMPAATRALMTDRWRQRCLVELGPLVEAGWWAQSLSAAVRRTYSGAGSVGAVLYTRFAELRDLPVPNHDRPSVKRDEQGEIVTAEPVGSGVPPPPGWRTRNEPQGPARGPGRAEEEQG